MRSLKISQRGVHPVALRKIPHYFPPPIPWPKPRPKKRPKPSSPVWLWMTLAFTLFLSLGCAAGIGSEPDERQTGQIVHEGPAALAPPEVLAFERGRLIRIALAGSGHVIARAHAASDGDPTDLVVDVAGRYAHVVAVVGDQRVVATHALYDDAIGPAAFRAQVEAPARLLALSRERVLVFASSPLERWLVLRPSGEMSGYALPAPTSVWREATAAGDTMAAAVDGGRRIINVDTDGPLAMQRDRHTIDGGLFAPLTSQDGGLLGARIVGRDVIVTSYAPDTSVRRSARFDIGGGDPEQLVLLRNIDGGGRYALLSAHPTRVTVIDAVPHAPLRVASILLQERLRRSSAPRDALRRDMVAAPQGLLVAGVSRLLRLRVVDDGGFHLAVDPTFDGAGWSGPLAVLPRPHRN